MNLLGLSQFYVNLAGQCQSLELLLVYQIHYFILLIEYLACKMAIFVFFGGAALSSGITIVCLGFSWTIDWNLFTGTTASSQSRLCT